MADIFFSVDQELGASERDDLLSRVGAIPGVHVAGQVSADSSRAATRAKCFARLLDGASPEPVLEALRALPGVRVASVAASRRLP